MQRDYDNTKHTEHCVVHLCQIPVSMFAMFIMIAVSVYIKVQPQCVNNPNKTRHQNRYDTGNDRQAYNQVGL